MEREHWAVVANVKKEIPYGPGGNEIKSGLKKFKAGAKVYIVGVYYGTCEVIVAIGQHRHTGKFVSCIIRANCVENLRVKKIHRPQMLAFLEHFKPNGAYMASTEAIANEFANIIPKWARDM